MDAGDLQRRAAGGGDGPWAASHETSRNFLLHVQVDRIIVTSSVLASTEYQITISVSDLIQSVILTWAHLSSMDPMQVQGPPASWGGDFLSGSALDSLLALGSFLTKSRTGC